MTEENGVERDDKGRFGKGNSASANRGPNHVSRKVKEAIVNFLEDNMDKIQKDFDQLKPRDRLIFISDILPYATPKLSAVQSENETNVKGGITIRWEEPDLQNRQGEGGTGDIQGN